MGSSYSRSTGAGRQSPLAVSCRPSHLLQPAPYLLSEHLLGTKFCTGLEDTQQVSLGVRTVIMSTIWAAATWGNPNCTFLLELIFLLAS